MYCISLEGNALTSLNERYVLERTQPRKIQLMSRHRTNRRYRKTKNTFISAAVFVLVAISAVTGYEYSDNSSGRESVNVDISKYVKVENGNEPFFSEGDMTTTSYEEYSELDELGRCGVARACIGKDIMPTEPRGEIGMVKPSGWHTVKYPGVVEGNYLYNRCHLIAYCLAGENANEKNLITGTRFLNNELMLPYELKVAKYIDSHPDNHVLYRVTPKFDGDNLVCREVLMEACSVEDGGRGVKFCVSLQNVQPGIRIDYQDGYSTIE